MKKYSDADLIETAKRFANRQQWKQFDGNKQYQIAKLRKLVPQCTAHMIDERTVKKYSDEEILTVALRYKSSTEWKQTEGNTYSIAVQRGLLPRCTAHMIRKPGIYDGIYKIYVYEFSDKHAYVGLTCSWEIRHEGHKAEGAVYEHSCLLQENPVLKTLQENLPSPADAAIAERRWIRKYVKDGWTMLNKARGGSTGNIGKTYWTKEKVLASAKQFQVKTRWFEMDGPAYAAARKYKWFTEATAHMIDHRFVKRSDETRQKMRISALARRKREKQLLAPTCETAISA